MVFVNLMVALIAVLELKLGQSASVFDVYPIKMGIFCVVFAIHGILLLAKEQQNENDGGIMSKAILFSGSLGVVILFQVIFPVLGCLLLVLWVVCFFKVVFEELYVIRRPLRADQILQAITEFYWEIRRLIGTHVRQQNRPPV